MNPWRAERYLISFTYFNQPNKLTTAQSSLHILLAEDNDFNQEIVVDLLTEAGHLVTATNNGQELLNALQTKPENFYQLILMDLEMPVLDGHQATTRIRENRQFDYIPIIAMTAHTSDNTKVQCAKEGMQDYISKPFNPDALFDVVKRWTTLEQPSNSNTSISSAENIPHSQQPIHTYSINLLRNFGFEYIDKDLGLQLAGSRPELYIQLLERFHISQVANLTIINQIKEEDLQSAEFLRMIHTLKGVSATIGATQLAKLIAELETYLANTGSQHSAMATAKVYLLAISELLTLAIDEIKAFFSTKKLDEQINSSSPLSKLESSILINSFISMLAAASNDAVDFFHQHSDDLAQAISPAHFKELVCAIDQYDFDRAIAQLQPYQVKDSTIPKQ